MLMYYLEPLERGMLVVKEVPRDYLEVMEIHGEILFFRMQLGLEDVLYTL